MELKPGMRLRSVASATEIVVVRGAPGEMLLTCCGEQMVDQASGRPPVSNGVSEAQAMVGKRYVDETSGLEVLCTREGGGPLACDGRELALRSPKPLPSTD